MSIREIYGEYDMYLLVRDVRLSTFDAPGVARVSKQQGRRCVGYSRRGKSGPIQRVKSPMIIKLGISGI